MVFKKATFFFVVFTAILLSCISISVAKAAGCYDTDGVFHDGWKKPHLVGSLLDSNCICKEAYTCGQDFSGCSANNSSCDTSALCPDGSHALEYGQCAYFPDTDESKCAKILDCRSGEPTNSCLPNTSSGNDSCQLIKDSFVTYFQNGMFCTTSHDQQLNPKVDCTPIDPSAQDQSSGQCNNDACPTEACPIGYSCNVGGHDVDGNPICGCARGNGLGLGYACGGNGCEATGNPLDYCDLKCTAQGSHGATCENDGCVSTGDINDFCTDVCAVYGQNDAPIEQFADCRSFSSEPNIGLYEALYGPLPVSPEDWCNGGGGCGDGRCVLYPFYLGPVCDCRGATNPPEPPSQPNTCVEGHPCGHTVFDDPFNANNSLGELYNVCGSGTCGNDPTAQTGKSCYCNGGTERQGECAKVGQECQTSDDCDGGACLSQTTSGNQCNCTNECLSFSSCTTNSDCGAGGVCNDNVCLCPNLWYDPSYHQQFPSLPYYGEVQCKTNNDCGPYGECIRDEVAPGTYKGYCQYNSCNQGSNCKNDADCGGGGNNSCVEAQKKCGCGNSAGGRLNIIKISHGGAGVFTFNIFPTPLKITVTTAAGSGAAYDFTGNTLTDFGKDFYDNGEGPYQIIEGESDPNDFSPDPNQHLICFEDSPPYLTPSQYVDEHTPNPEIENLEYNATEGSIKNLPHLGGVSCVFSDVRHPKSEGSAGPGGKNFKELEPGFQPAP